MLTINACGEISKSAMGVAGKMNKRKDHLNRVLFLLLDNIAWLLVGVSVVVFSLLSDRFLRSYTLINIIPKVVPIGILVIGQSFAMLTKHFDLSSESVLGLVAFSAALLIASPELGGWGTMLPGWMVIVLMLGAGVLIGMLNGFMITKLKLNNLVYTIAILITLRGICYLISPSSSASSLGEGFGWLGGGSLFTITVDGKPVRVPVSLLFFFLIFAAAHVIARYTRFGRNIYAVGADRAAAEAAGIRSERIIIAVYTISGFCAALAAWMLAGRMDSAAMKTGENWIFSIQAAAIIGGISLKGGRGNMIGAMGGVILWGVLNTGLGIAQASPWIIDAILGGLLLLAVLLDAVKNRYFVRKTLKEQLSQSQVGLSDNYLNVNRSLAQGAK
ncbi:MAG: ABC transporter permease [Kiritimatiellia bacterium]|jgi:ribose/xylose/arabinose/galactoside ABC-type transport system permease subunit|nr:ABC transporter permease [Kiritimatiellia bacterium]